MHAPPQECQPPPEDRESESLGTARLEVGEDVAKPLGVVGMGGNERLSLTLAKQTLDLAKGEGEVDLRITPLRRGDGRQPGCFPPVCLNLKQVHI